MLTTSASWSTGCRAIDLDRMICKPYLPPCLEVARQVTTSVQFAAISETTRPRRGLKSRDFSNVHPATKQLDGRMQTQALPSSLTVVPVFRASGHTTKTSAMPSSSTLHYAAKQLDDTVTNKRTQPHDRQLHISPRGNQNHKSPLSTAHGIPGCTQVTTKRVLQPSKHYKTLHNCTASMNLANETRVSFEPKDDARAYTHKGTPALTRAPLKTVCGDSQQ